MGNTRLLALWGSPGAGKTVTAVKLALELAAHKKNVVILMCDFTAPTPQTFLPNVSTEGKSLGDILALPSISQEVILKHCVPFSNNPYISLLGYKNGDSAFTYAKYSKERAVDLLTLLRHLADYVLIDCNSIISFDVLSAVALENADTVLRLCGCDLKSLSYFSSNLPIIADGRFAAGRHIKVLSAVKPGQDNGEYNNAHGGATYTLPFVSELEEQFYAARLMDELCTKPSKPYNAVVRAIVRDVLLDESVVSNANSLPSDSPKNPAHAIPHKDMETKMGMLRNLWPTRSQWHKQENTGGGLFDKLGKGGKS